MRVFFSIILPTYNRAAFLPKAIESVVSQVYTNWELIVVDDGSTDNTRQIVEGYAPQDKRVKYIYQKNAERCAARNKGIDLANGKYICFLDSDDYYLPERLSLLHQAILGRKSPIAVLYTDITTQDGLILTRHSYPSLKYINQFDLLVDQTIHSQQVCCAAAILKEFKYDIRFVVAEDKELWLRIATKYTFVYLPGQPTVVVVEHDQRTVGFNKPDSYEKHILTYKYIQKVHQRNFSSASIINKSIHDSYMGLARSYMHTGKNWMMLKAILVGSTYCINRTGREKIYLIVSNFYIFAPLMWMHNFFRKKIVGQNNKDALRLLRRYYDKIYVVSIERTRQHRFEKVKKNLFGLEFEFFEGTDATLLSGVELNKIANIPRSAELLDDFFLMRYGHKANRPLHKSEIGCSYSHVRIYQEMLKKNYQRVLILEDDAKIDFKCANLIAEILNEIPKDCEVLYWGYRWFDSESYLSRWKRLLFQSPINTLFSKLTGKKNLTGNERYPTPFKKHVWRAGLHAGTHAYSITKEGAQKMLRVNNPVVMNADQAITYLHLSGEMKCYVTVPLIFRDDQSVPTSLNI